MNKLENEYKQLMQSETPDLWSRIEAGIDASLVTSEASKSVRKSVVNWRKYSLPLVACIAAIMCVPLLLTGFFRMAGGTKGAAEADCAMVETTTATMDCVAEEAIEESAIEYATETCMDAADTEEAFVAEEAAEEEMAETEAYSIQSTEDGADAEGADTGGTGANKQALGEMAQATHTLTVTEIAVLDEKSAGSHEGGIVYHMVTEEKGECTLFVPDDSDYQIDMNGHFTIKAVTTDAWYDYVLLEIL